jgi:23S rRNA pseudouridine1911/1915/1917 synthase
VAPPLPVLHESAGVLAVAKPAGLPTQAPPGVDSAESLVRRWLFGPAADAGGRHPGGFLGVPHRLDRPVSGVLLLATTPRAARQLSRQFERRQVTKTYLALLDLTAAGPTGPVAGTAITWVDHVRKVPDTPRAEVVAAGAEGAREAVTTGRMVAVGTRIARVELVPTTGRMHQLRVQAAARGMPVLGDVLYGATRTVEGDDVREAAISLHAWRIAFRDPDSGLPVEVTCPPPPGLG